MRRSISWRASTALASASLGATRLLMALCRSLAMRAEKRARLGRMRGLALRQTSMTCRHRLKSAGLHASHQLRLQAAPTCCRVLQMNQEQQAMA